MAKGRRLTTSRSERLLGSYGFSNAHSVAGADAPELGEEEVWSMVDGSMATGGSEWSPRAGSESNGSYGGYSYRSHSSIPPHDGRHVGGLSLAFEGPTSSSAEKTAPSRILHNYRGQHDGVAPPPTRHFATSAPVNVPDWSRIYRVNSVESLHDSDDGMEDPDAGEMVPPHEYLAREYSGSRKLGGSSVFEGYGRTLKGRDMWRVRDAVWSQTGFDG